MVVKLDIDNNPLETLLVRQLLADPELVNLVDEFFWEHHVHNRAAVLGCFSRTTPAVRRRKNHSRLSSSRPRGISSSRPRRCRDPSPRNIRVAAAAAPRLSEFGRAQVWGSPLQKTRVDLFDTKNIGWGKHMPRRGSQDSQLADSYRIFAELRERGVRAHAYI